MINGKFKLPDGSYSVSNILDYRAYIKKKHEEKTDNPPIKIYAYKIKHGIKTKTGYYLEL